MPDSTLLPPDLQKQVDAATVAEKLATARKAQAEAISAESAAALSGLKAVIGEPAAGPFSGGVDLGDGALAEVNVLARRQLQVLASKACEVIRDVIRENAAVYLTSSDSPPSFGHSDLLEDRLAAVDAAVEEAHALTDATAKTTSLQGAAASRSLAAPLEAAGLVLSGANALLGFFKTDYKLAGPVVTVSDRLIMVLIGREIIGSDPDAGRKVYLDSGLPEASDKDREAVRKTLSSLASRVSVLRNRLTGHAAGAPDTNGGEGVSPPSAPRRDQALAACRNASDLYDALQASLTADAGGQPFLERALRERRLRSLLKKDGVVLSVKADGAWGTSLITKNLWSGLGRRAPIKVSATVGLSWIAYKAEDHGFIAGDVVTSSSGLYRLDEVTARAKIRAIG